MSVGRKRALASNQAVGMAAEAREMSGAVRADDGKQPATFIDRSPRSVTRPLSAIVFIYLSVGGAPCESGPHKHQRCPYSSASDEATSLAEV